MILHAPIRHFERDVLPVGIHLSLFAAPRSSVQLFYKRLYRACCLLQFTEGGFLLPVVPLKAGSGKVSSKE